MGRGQGKSTNLFYDSVQRNPNNPALVKLFARAQPEQFLEAFYQFFQKALERDAKTVFLERNSEGRPSNYKVIFSGHYVEEKLVITAEVHYRGQMNQSPWPEEQHLDVNDLLALGWHEEFGFQDLCRERLAGRK